MFLNSTVAASVSSVSVCQAIPASSGESLTHSLGMPLALSCTEVQRRLKSYLSKEKLLEMLSTGKIGIYFIMQSSSATPSLSSTAFPEYVLGFALV